MPIYTSSGRKSFIPYFYKRISLMNKIRKDSSIFEKNDKNQPNSESRKSSPYPIKVGKDNPNTKCLINHNPLLRLQSLTSALYSRGKYSFRRSRNKYLYNNHKHEDTTKNPVQTNGTKCDNFKQKERTPKESKNTRKSEYQQRSLPEKVNQTRKSLVNRYSILKHKTLDLHKEEEDLAFLCQLLLIRTLSPQIISEDNNISKDFDQTLDERYFEYYPQIFRYLYNREKLISFNNNYLTANNFTASFRCILVDWLIKVQIYSKVRTESLQVAITLVDMFTSLSLIKRSFYQLVGVTGLLIASKVVQRFHPKIKSLCYLTDNCYQPSHILQMEKIMLEKLDFFVNVPIPSNFHHRGLLACVEIMDTNKLDHFCNFMFDLIILDPSSPGLKPSCKAAASILLGRYILYPEYSPWSKILRHYTFYNIEQLRECVLVYIRMLGNIYDNDHYPYKAVVEKYSHVSCRYIATEARLVEFSKCKKSQAQLERLFV